MNIQRRIDDSYLKRLRQRIRQDMETQRLVAALTFAFVGTAGTISLMYWAAVHTDIFAPLLEKAAP